MTEITLTFPDGSKRPYKQGISGRDLAAAISKSLAKKAVAMLVDGRLADLADPIAADASVKILSRTDPEALELIRHDCAHVMAEAVQALWPGTQVTIGPVIENGFFYDFAKEEPFHPDDLARIEAKMHEIVARNAPFTKELWSREDAKAFFKKKGELFKIELVDAIPEGEDLKIYKQGEWLDLCRGPHMTSTGQIGKAFKLTHFAGSYWRGNAQGPKLQRIYGTAWASEPELAAYLKQLEEAEKRDHRKLGREMDLFHFQEEGPGVVFWHPKGWELFQNLINYMRRRQNAAGYREVNSPQILDKSMWETSGHWEWYRENMFTTITEDEREFAIKPMNCPGHVQIFKHGLRSYRELPYRVCRVRSRASLRAVGCAAWADARARLHAGRRARLLHRGADGRRVHEDQRADLVDLPRLRLRRRWWSSSRPGRRSASATMRCGITPRPPCRTCSRRSAATSNGKVKTGINPGEGAFYGPKFEYVLRDAIGRDWQCGTTQVDFNLPERFGAFYIDADGEKKRPVMIHRAMFGSLERFTGVLLEKYRRPPAAVAVAAAGDGVHHRVGCRRLCGGGAGGLDEERACAPRPTCATRRSTTRCASTR